MAECYNEMESFNAMLVLGHAGITLGAATLLAGAWKNSRSSQSRRVSWFTSLGSRIDIRILLVGSLLPDIIDKPVGQVFFRETFSNGRIFSHTLLFLILLTAAGCYLYRRRQKVWLLTLAFGTLMHIVLDQMWFAPATLFWPLLGFTFARSDLTGWVINLFQALRSDPVVYLSELAGLALLLWFGLSLVGGKRVGAFIKYGKVN